MEFSIQILPPPSPKPTFMEKKSFFSHNFLYVFIVFIVTKVGENFEDNFEQKSWSQKVWLTARNSAMDMEI